MAEKNVLVARYEDLQTNYAVETAKLVKYLGLKEDSPAVQEVIESYRPGTSEGQQGLHFYKGRIGRFREVYTNEQKRIMLSKLVGYLERMGYETV